MKGEGNSLDFGARIHDPRLGRFLSLDPLSSKYPGESNYAFVSNNPMIYVDPDGQDRILYKHVMSKDGKVISTQMIVDKGVYKAIWRETYNGMGYFTKHDFREDHYYYIDQDKPYSKVINLDYASGQEISFREYLSIKAGGIKDVVMPQLMIFGSADSHGTNLKPNPNRPVFSIDLKSDEPWNTISNLLDIKSPADLKGADAEKVAGFSWVLIDRSSVRDLKIVNAGSNSRSLSEREKSSGSSFFFYRLDNFLNEKAGTIQDHKYTRDTVVRYGKGINGEKDTFFIKRVDNDK